jgi:uncharacterized protein YdaU (DUF1376 family)
LNWYKRYMGDYATKTAGLSLTERGAYDALLDEYYTQEGPLPKDKQELYRIVRAFERWERAAVDSVLAKFFASTDAGYTNPRADEELAKYKKAADIHRANGRRHGTNLHPNSNLKPLEIPDTRNQINAKSKDIGALRAPPPKFQPPGLSDVAAYMVHLGMDPSVEAQKFIDHHSQRKWKVSGGRGPVMTDWRAAVRTWKANMGSFGGANGAGKSHHAEKTARTFGAAARVLADLDGGADEMCRALKAGNQ